MSRCNRCLRVFTRTSNARLHVIKSKCARQGWAPEALIPGIFADLPNNPPPNILPLLLNDRHLGLDHTASASAVAGAKEQPAADSGSAVVYDEATREYPQAETQDTRSTSASSRTSAVPTKTRTFKEVTGIEAGSIVCSTSSTHTQDQGMF
jgi:hypothetical protein